MVAVEQFAFALLHHRLLVGLCVVMSQEVEDPVDEEQRHLIDIVPLPVYGLSTGHRRADHHVAQQHRLVPGHLGGIVYREGQDIGRTAVTVEVVVPKVCDRLFVHEVDREFYARLVEVLGDEHVCGEASPSIGVDLGTRTGGSPFVDDHDRGNGFRRFVAHPGQEPLRLGVLRS